MKRGKCGLAFGLAAVLLIVGEPAGGRSRKRGNGVVLAEARRRRPETPSPPLDTGPVGVLQEIEEKDIRTGEKYNYNQALYLSNLFYEAQRAGTCVPIFFLYFSFPASLLNFAFVVLASLLQLIELMYIRLGEYPSPWRHSLTLPSLRFSFLGKLPKDNRIPWRRDSNIADGFLSHHDLSGGYYDAGDYIIFGWPLASATTVLAWGLLEYEDAYTQTGELGHTLATVKWPLDWLLKAHVAPDTLYVQVGDGKVEHEYWGR